jgi:hypothetical protein
MPGFGFPVLVRALLSAGRGVSGINVQRGTHCRRRERATRSG